MSTVLAGERIRAVRYLLGISQTELSHAASVSQSQISQVENGTREANNEMLDAIAAATATPRSFFSLAPPDVPLGTLRFRKRATARQGDTKRVKALFDEGYRIAADLMIEMHYPRPSLPTATDEVTDDDIEELALRTREALQLGDDGPIRHVTRACERAGIAVMPLSFPGDQETENEAVGHFGVSCWPGPDDPALVGYFAGGPGDLQRYTLAHELGHLTLHSRRKLPDDPEAEANRFAGALLMPRDRAGEALAGGVDLRDLQGLKARWGISIQALIMRGSHLGLIDQQRKGSLFKQLSARGLRRNEPVTVHPEDPILIGKLLSRKFGEPLPYARVADAVGLHAVILRSLVPPSAAASSNRREHTGPKVTRLGSR